MFGKSTISAKIASSKKKSALIEGDDIYHQVIGGYINAWKDGNHLTTFWKVCINSIKTYLDDGYDVIFNYIVTPEDLKLICSKVNCNTIRFVVLSVDEKTLILRDSERPKDCQMGNRSIILLNSFKDMNYPKLNVLDSSDLSISETIETIENDNRFLI